MKRFIPILAIAALTACHGKAENANAEAQLEEQNTVAATTAAMDPSIPVGVQVLPPDETINLKDKPGHLVVIDFNATWCAPCLEFAPIFEEAAEEYAGQVQFVSVDVDQHQELVQQLGIRSIPFIVFMGADGQLNTWTGFLPKADFYKAINELK